MRQLEPPESFRGEHNNVLREADRITISQFAPPGVVNAEFQVLQFPGPTKPARFDQLHQILATVSTQMT